MNILLESRLPFLSSNRVYCVKARVLKWFCKLTVVASVVGGSTIFSPTTTNIPTKLTEILHGTKIKKKLIKSELN